jgi:hypothetical protein
VDAVRDYVPLGKLEVGTVLHVQGGGEAILVSKTWRQGEFEVFDFEVEGLHNFYVRGEGSDAAGVLVHNSTGKKIPNSELLAPPAKRGRAPTGGDGNPVELHHRGQAPDSPLDEMTRTDHRGKGNFKKNHENTGQEPSKIDRKAWKKEREDYWKGESDNGRFDDMQDPD